VRPRKKADELQNRLETEPYVAGNALEMLDHHVMGRVLGYTERRVPNDPAHALVEVFRGPESRVRDLQRVYLPLLDDHEPVLDVGCGRGEFLDIAREAGLEVEGVEADPEMVEHCRRKGHKVTQGDVVDRIQSLPGASIGLLFSAQVVEHLPYSALVRLLTHATRKIKPDGIMILETVNVHMIEAFKTFFLDPTHTTPLFPESLLTLCQAVGFESAYAFHPFGAGDFSRDRTTQPTFAVVASLGEGELQPAATS
jgi:2-polyprenyl-3-methyl-5-hydroxy-6-metoxy-1,4-benzoquinol methylase